MNINNNFMNRFWPHLVWWAILMASSTVLLRTTWHGSALPGVVEAIIVFASLALSLLSAIKIIMLLNGLTNSHP